MIAVGHPLHKGTSRQELTRFLIFYSAGQSFVRWMKSLADGIVCLNVQVGFRKLKVPWLES